MSRPPTDVTGYVETAPMAGLYVKVVDDFPGGIYVLGSIREDSTGEGWDNWFENWDETTRFFERQVGSVTWQQEPA